LRAEYKSKKTEGEMVMCITKERKILVKESKEGG